MTTWKPHLISLVAALSILGACRTAGPPIRFAPPGTDLGTLRSKYALTDFERRMLTQESFRKFSQEQVDQIYLRLASGPVPDGPFRGDLFFPRDRDGRARIRELADPALPLTTSIATMRAEDLGRVFWKGKAFFRSQGILRNRIDDLLILRPIIKDADKIPKMTFDGETTWLLFPAELSCGTSRLDSTRRSTVIDYAKGSKIEGYREIPDKLAGPEGLNIFDEVRVVRPGLYLGRAYFGQRFALNFTLLDPGIPADAPLTPEIQEDCNVGPTGNKVPSARVNRLSGSHSDSRDRHHRVRTAGAAARHGSR